MRPETQREARRRPFEVVRQRQREAVLAGFHETDPGLLRCHTRFARLSEYVQRVRLQEAGLPEHLLAAHGLRWALVLEVWEAARRLPRSPARSRRYLVGSLATFGIASWHAYRYA